jgi:uncharacterized membrane protein YdjX (TVP38/TMEM64 family)
MEYFQRVSLPLAGTVFVAAYIGITFFIWFAKDVFRVVGAVVFGPYWSTLFIWIGELVNAAIFFHLSRKLGRAYIADQFHLKEGTLNRANRHGGVWHIFLLRTLPIIPFRIIDLAYGLTSVSFRKYIVVSALATPVRIFWVQFVVAALGGAIFDFNRAMAYFEKNILLFWLSFLYLFCSLIIVLFLRKKIR